MKPPSTAAKAYIAGLIAILAAVAGMFATSTLGQVAAIAGAGLTAYLGVFRTKNAETDPNTVGGIAAGTTGVVGSALDATLGKVLPTSGKHAA